MRQHAGAFRQGRAGGRRSLRPELSVSVPKGSQEDEEEEQRLPHTAGTSVRGVGCGGNGSPVSWHWVAVVLRSWAQGHW